MFPIINLKSHPTHSLISPPHLATVVLTALSSCWVGGRKPHEVTPTRASWNTPNHQQLTTGRLATLAGDFPTGRLAALRCAACRLTEELAQSMLWMIQNQSYTVGPLTWILTACIDTALVLQTINTKQVFQKQPISNQNLPSNSWKIRHFVF